MFFWRVPGLCRFPGAIGTNPFAPHTLVGIVEADSQPFRDGSSPFAVSALARLPDQQIIGHYRET